MFWRVLRFSFTVSAFVRQGRHNRSGQDARAFERGNSSGPRRKLGIKGLCY